MYLEYNTGIYFMLLNSVLMTKQEIDKLHEINLKYQTTPKGHNFLNREDIDFLIRIQNISILNMKEDIKTLRNNNKILEKLIQE